MTDHYEFMVAEIDSLRLGLDKLKAEHDAVVAERDQLRRDLDETRERLGYHMRLASERACAT